jgi:transposase-like protein
MMLDNRRTSTAACKREAVHLVTEQAYALADAARKLGLKPQMLQRWKRARAEEAQAAFPGTGRVSPAQAERHRLREEHQRVRLVRDMLQKALGFFASESSCETPSSSSTGSDGHVRSCVRDWMCVVADCTRTSDRKPPRRLIEMRSACGLGAKRGMGRRDSVMMAKPRQAEGCAVGRAKARRFTQEAGRTVRRRPRRRPVTTASQQRDPVAPKLLARQGEVEHRAQGWAGAMTYSNATKDSGVLKHVGFTSSS